MNAARLLAYAQLLRIPNVFTALADIALGATVAAALLPSRIELWLAYSLLGLTSGSLYLAGMVWNDVFDYAEDKKTRPFRPLPSGRIRRRTAIGLGVMLLAVGVAFAALAGWATQPDWHHEPLVLAVAIVVAVLIYDGGMKRTPAGPVAMAACRFLNVLLGLSLIPDEMLPTELRVWLAAVVGFYILGVTWFARTEEGRSRPRDLVLAAGVMAFALLVALLLRAKLHNAAETLPALAAAGTWAFPYLLVCWGFLIGIPIAAAIREPSPRLVQAAVKRCVLGLIALDALLATMFVGLWGLLILLLLPPALVVGKWVYST
ncbi:MAG: UbiA family prenyltransferase [Gemmata sp.]|nr:UbiA family prenyltransferase [Gemmata sp.]